MATFVLAVLLLWFVAIPAAVVVLVLIRQRRHRGHSLALDAALHTWLRTDAAGEPTMPTAPPRSGGATTPSA